MTKRLFSLLFIVCGFFTTLHAHEPFASKSIFEIRIYHFTTSDQEKTLDEFLKNGFLPALHRQNIKQVGVFKPLSNDTAADKRVYVLIPYKSIQDFEKTFDKLKTDKTLAEAVTDFTNAPYNKPVYSRMEKIITRAFEGLNSVGKPQLTGSRQENIYELRSYESPSEKILSNKIDMFIKGNAQGYEVSLFKRLNFNPVFYSEVLAGATMPNLMYMTSFNNMKERDEHWKAFFADPVWKALSADPNFQRNVSKNVTIFLHPTEYSDL